MADDAVYINTNGNLLSFPLTCKFDQWPREGLKIGGGVRGVYTNFLER